MKQWKKNMVAAAVLVTVCTGIYLNWLYTDQQTAGDLTDTLDAEKVMSDELLSLVEDAQVLSDQAVDTATDYFAAVRLSRQQARDSALNLLQEATRTAWLTWATMAFPWRWHPRKADCKRPMWR